MGDHHQRRILELLRADVWGEGSQIRSIIGNFSYPTLFESIAILAIVFIAAFVAYRKKNWSRLKRAMLPVFVLYLGFVIGITILYRYPFNQGQYNLELFWSYKKNSRRLYLEILLNYLMLFPLGLITPLYVKRRWVVLDGLIFSLSIEVMQLLLKRGLFEFDDIVGNMAGVLIGIGVYSVVKSMRRRLTGGFE